MTIRKQDFYEGAALHSLARTSRVTSIKYEPPFFLVNNRLLVHLKYSTKGRSPWGFTFMPEEQLLLEKKASQFKIIIGLICGADGVAALPYDAYRTVATARTSAIHISCYREHGAHYELSGPDGTVNGKVAPAEWRRILED